MILKVNTKSGTVLEVKAESHFTEWNYYGYEYWNDKGQRPKHIIHSTKRLTFIFKCPYCFKQRQLTNLATFVCGSVTCKCSQTFRLVYDIDECTSCEFKMKCLAEGLVKVKRTKIIGSVIDDD